MNILITGANGFIGKVLVNKLLNQDHNLIAVVRNSQNLDDSKFSEFIVDDINSETNWVDILDNVDIVIHTAARVHILNDGSNNPLVKFREVNTFGTINLARKAVAAGVKRFVFISSIGVNGINNSRSFTELDTPTPSGPYAISKYEAELALLKLSNETGLEVVIIRPPLVYGPNAPGNFKNLMKWMCKGIYMPLGSVRNIRSFIALDNLVDFISLCIDHKKAANEIFLISDGEDVSTTELLQKVAKAFGKKPLLIPVPVILMKLAAKLLGKSDVADRLFGSLLVDSSKARDLLGWKPVISMDDELKKTVEVYLNEKNI